MRNGLKRATALAMTILMLLALLPAALAEEETNSEPVIPGISLLEMASDYRAAFDELMAADDATFAELAPAYMADDGFMAWLDQAVASGELTEAALSAFAARLNAGISTLAITGESQIAVGETVTLTSNVGSGNQQHRWESDDSGIVGVRKDSNTPETATTTVIGVSPGETTIRHSIYTRTFFGWDWQVVDTYTVTVVGEQGNEAAIIYYLKSPTSDPNSNAVNQWGSGIYSGTVNTTGATWVDADEHKDKNVFNPAPYVVSMAAGMVQQTDGSWLMPRDRYREHYDDIFTKYRSQIAADLEIAEDELTIDDIDAIYLTPYKISRNNDTTPDKHIDCIISIKTNDFFAARFWVTKAGETQPLMVDSANYRQNARVAKTENAPTDVAGAYPAEVTVGGIRYVFDGWYGEDGEKIAEDEWSGGYLPSDAELSEGTVDFYAYYVPAETEITVSKDVVSDVPADSTRAFTFNYTITEEGGKTTPGSVELQNGGEAVIRVPIGASFAIQEVTTPAEGEQAFPFTTQYMVDGTEGKGPAATINAVQKEGHVIAFLNTRATGALVVEKQVTGSMGDRQKEFSFTYTYNLGAGDVTGEFTLGHGDTFEELAELPIGTVVTVEETDYTGENGGYTTQYEIGDAEAQNGRSAQVTIGEGENWVVFTNDKEARPDTGIVTDSLPYVLILACVIAVVVVVVIRGRNRHDD